jgi:Ca-activated chloride channel homolog
VIARPDAPLEHLGNHARRGRGDAVDIRVPSLPGKYELRYLIDQRRQLVARRPIEVDPLRLSLEVPASAIAGGPLTVRLVGEANPGDLVVIVAEGAPDDATTVNARVRRGDIELRLPRLPLEPGRYEVRYLIDRGRVVVARRPLRIDPPAP